LPGLDVAPKTIRLLLALVMGISSLAEAKPRPRRWVEEEPLLDRFYAAVARKDDARTIQLGEELARSDPRSPTLVKMLTQVHNDRHLWPQTIAHATRCLAVLRNDYDCLSTRANAHHALGQYKEELADLTALAGLDTLRRHAEVYRLLGDYPHATADYKAIIADRPGDPVAYLGLCRVATGEKNFPAAIENLKIALRAGFTAYAQLDTDPALAPLRGTKEYRDLMSRERPPGL
jgi:tetratricopeptide (TPR) repeat protein